MKALAEMYHFHYVDSRHRVPYRRGGRFRSRFRLFRFLNIYAIMHEAGFLRGRSHIIIIIIIIIIITIITPLSITYNNCVGMTSLISSHALCPQSTYTGFIVTRTLPATYVYGIYRHAHSAHHVHIWDLSSRAKLWNDYMRFRIIV